MLAALILAAASTQPQALTEAEAMMLSCASKPDAERLACFDAAARTLSAPVSDAREVTAPAAAAPIKAGAGSTEDEPATTPPTVSASNPARDPAPMPASPPRRPMPGADDVPDAFEAAVAGIEFGPRGGAIVTLANGEVFKQLRSDSRALRRRDAERAERAIIKDGALGSTRLTIEPGGRTIRVTRIR